MTLEWLVLGAAMTGGGAFFAFARPRAALQLTDGAPMRVGDLRIGAQASLTGALEADETLQAPLSGRSCFFWRVQLLNQNVDFGDGPTQTPAEIFELSDVARGLRLRDATGTVLLDASRCDLVTRTRLVADALAYPEFYESLVRNPPTTFSSQLEERTLSAGPAWVSGVAEQSSLGLALGGETPLALSDVAPAAIERAGLWVRVAGALTALAGAAALARGLL